MTRIHIRSLLDEVAQRTLEQPVAARRDLVHDPERTDALTVIVVVSDAEKAEETLVPFAARRDETAVGMKRARAPIKSQAVEQIFGARGDVGTIVRFGND